MKVVINQLAQTSPDLDRAAFEKAYAAGHRAPEILTQENYRQAFDQYRAAARKIKRVAKAREGTTGP